MPDIKDPLDPKKNPNVPSPTDSLKEQLQSEIDDLEKTVSEKMGPAGKILGDHVQKELDPMEGKIIDAIAKSGMGTVALGALKKVKTAIQEKMTSSESTRQNKDPFDVTPRERDDNNPPKNR